MDETWAWCIVTELAFGVVYAYAVHQYTLAHPEHPYVSFFVVGGVFGTITITMLIMPGMIGAGITILIAFVLTGVPQIAGDIHRNTNRAVRRESREAQLTETVNQLERKLADVSQQLTDLQIEVEGND